MGSQARVTCWTITGTAFIFFSLAFIIFASAFPYWQQRELSRQAGYPNIGLWEICFREEGETAPTHVQDELGKRYYGCNYVFDRELRTILSWIYPGKQGRQMPFGLYYYEGQLKSFLPKYEGVELHVDV